MTAAGETDAEQVRTRYSGCHVDSDCVSELQAEGFVIHCKGVFHLRVNACWSSKEIVSPDHSPHLHSQGAASWCLISGRKRKRSSRFPTKC